MFKLLAAASLLALTATPALAHSKSDVVGSVTADDLAELVKSHGDTIDDPHPFDDPSVQGKTADGLLYVLIGTACNEEAVKRCNGVMMQVRYDSDDTVTTDKIADANFKYAAVSSWWDRGGKVVGFSRYVVLDDGVTWSNLGQNLAVLLDVSSLASEVIWPPKK